MKSLFPIALTVVGFGVIEKGCEQGFICQHLIGYWIVVIGCALWKVRN